MTALRIVCGLGNPGPKYQDSRHNLGFWVVELLSERFKGRWRRPSDRFLECRQLQGDLGQRHQGDLHPRDGALGRVDTTRPRGHDVGAGRGPARDPGRGDQVLPWHELRDGEGAVVLGLHEALALPLHGRG